MTRRRHEIAADLAWRADQVLAAMVEEDNARTLMDGDATRQAIATARAQRMLVAAHLRLHLTEYRQAAAADGPPDDPLSLPLPCDIKIGNVRMREGWPLRELVHRMQILYDVAVKAPPEPPDDPAEAPVEQAPKPVRPRSGALAPRG